MLFFSFGIDTARKPVVSFGLDTTFQLDDFAQDKVLFDSRAALGLRAAGVPVSGRAPSGTVIEVRVVSEHGATVTPWQQVVAGKHGIWDILLSCPLRWFWMKIQARLKTKPDDLAETRQRFGVGHVLSVWGDAPVLQHWQGTAIVDGPAVASIMDHVIALKDDRTSNGCQWTDRFKTPVTDPLPSGVRLSGRRLLISADVAFEGWDFTGYLLSVRAVLSLRNCVLGERDGPTGLVAGIDVQTNGGYDVIEYCDFIGPSQEGGYDSFLKLRGAANDNVAWPIFRRNRIWGHCSDGIKPNKGLVAFNYFDTPINLNSHPVPYDPSVTYESGILVLSAQNKVWRALRENVGVTPPANIRTESEDWENLDPHSDQITVFTCRGGLELHGNYLNRDQDARYHDVPEHAVTGLNNAVRLARNPGPAANTPYDKVVVEFCYSPTGRVLPSLAVQVKDAASSHPLVPPEIRHNAMDLASSGHFLHPDSSGLFPIWSDNRTTSGAVLPRPANTVEGTSVTFDAAGAVRMVWRDGDQVRSSDADGVTERMVAFSDALSAARPGERFVVVHHGDVRGADAVWSGEVALHNAAPNAGLVLSDWSGTDGLPDRGAVLARLFGRDDRGDRVTLPAVFGDITVGHSLAGLYDGPLHLPFDAQRLQATEPDAALEAFLSNLQSDPVFAGDFSKAQQDRLYSDALSGVILAALDAD